MPAGAPFSSACTPTPPAHGRGASVPLVFGAAPFFTRQVESALAQMDKGLEAAVSVVQWLGERIARRGTH